MATVQEEIPTFRPILHKSPVNADFVCRAGSRDRLGAGRQTSTLGETPARYGKNTAMTRWLEKGDVPLASVPLGEGGRLAAATRSMSPKACRHRAVWTLRNPSSATPSGSLREITQ
jgi:hypothetical protein